jgi:hypothetical protein
MPVTTHQNRINVIRAVPEAYVPKLTCVCDPKSAKIKGREVVSGESQPAPPAPVVDILDALKKSLAAARKPGGGSECGSRIGTTQAKAPSQESLRDFKRSARSREQLLFFPLARPVARILDLHQGEFPARCAKFAASTGIVFPPHLTSVPVFSERDET